MAEAIDTNLGEASMLTCSGSIPTVVLFEKVFGLKTVLMRLGLDSDNIHLPNEKFELPNYYNGIETLPLFHKYFAEMAKS